MKNSQWYMEYESDEREDRWSIYLNGDLVLRLWDHEDKTLAEAILYLLKAQDNPKKKGK